MVSRRAGALRLLAALVGGGALVGAAATEISLGPSHAGPATPATVTASPPRASYLPEAVLACPGVVEDRAGEAAAVAQTRLRVASAPVELFADVPPPDGGAGGLQLALVGVADEAPAGDGAQGRGEALGTTLEDGRWGAVRAHDQLAPGVVGSQLTLDPEAGARGWALTPCVVPADVVHLVGGGEGAGRVELVVVTNPAADPVTVDIEVFGADGPVPTVGGSGLVVPARGRLVHRLDALAPSARHPVVRVAAQGGPVVAHLAERHRDGTTDRGREVAAPAVPPARELVVPALPVAADGRRVLTLRLFAPDGAAVVELRALTRDGGRVPDPAVVRVPAGGTLEVPLEDLPDGASGLRLRSDAPVTAGALLQVAPASDEPIVLEHDGEEGALEEPTGAAGTDAAGSTAGPDDARSTAGPDQAQVTAAPDGATTTAGPDHATRTTGPDDATRTAGPDDEDDARQVEPVLHPAGESAWVAAVSLSQVPLGIALPDLTDVPELAQLADLRDDESDAGEQDPRPDEQPGPVVELAVSAVDATTATVLWLKDGGDVRTEDLTLANDTTQVLPVPTGTAAVWVLPTGGTGVAAALHLAHRDLVGPYLSAATVPPVPWTRDIPEVLPVLP